MENRIINTRTKIMSVVKKFTERLDMHQDRIAEKV